MSKRISEKPRLMYKRDIRKIEENAAAEVLILVTAYLMDEFEYDEDKIIELWNGVTRYSDAINKEKLITINQVCEIIEKNTGLKLGRWK